MGGSSKIAKLQHKLANRDRIRLHVLLRLRMIACGRGADVNRLLQEARHGKTPTLEELNRGKLPGNKEIIPEAILEEILSEMDYCHGPRVVIPPVEPVDPLAPRIPLNYNRQQRFDLH